jgi:hypothetical protein
VPPVEARAPPAERAETRQQERLIPQRQQQYDNTKNWNYNLNTGILDTILQLTEHHLNFNSNSRRRQQQNPEEQEFKNTTIRTSTMRLTEPQQQWQQIYRTIMILLYDQEAILVNHATQCFHDDHRTTRLYSI